MKSIYLVLAIAVALSLGVVLYLFTHTEYEFTYGFQLDTAPRTVVLEGGLDRERVAKVVAKAFRYTEKEEKQFHDTYRIMQWNAFKEELIPFLMETHALTEHEREILLTHNAVYLQAEEDVLEGFYVPGTYAFTAKDSMAEIAEKLIAGVGEDDVPTILSERMSESAVSGLLAYVRNAQDLLPDLIPLPPQDVGIRTEGSRVLLVFSTIYYNAGNGNLELRADPSTIGVLGDIERIVYQRIMRTDGSFRQREAGTFEWHQEHLHYHFKDFVEYILTAVAEDGTEATSTAIAQKSTFCIRDVSKVFIDSFDEIGDAEYMICGRERQGITKGWGDAYFQTYVDQNLDITDLESGRYRLTFDVNPLDRFDEMTKDNNVASALFEYDKDAGTVRIIETFPMSVPEFEHIHVDE